MLRRCHRALCTYQHLSDIVCLCLWKLPKIMVGLAGHIFLQQSLERVRGMECYFMWGVATSWNDQLTCGCVQHKLFDQSKANALKIMCSFSCFKHRMLHISVQNGQMLKGSYHTAIVLCSVYLYNVRKHLWGSYQSVWLCILTSQRMLQFWLLNLYVNWGFTAKMKCWKVSDCFTRVFQIPHRPCIELLIVMDEFQNSWFILFGTTLGQ